MLAVIDMMVMIKNAMIPRATRLYMVMITATILVVVMMVVMTKTKPSFTVE